MPDLERAREIVEDEALRSISGDNSLESLRSVLFLSGVTGDSASARERIRERVAALKWNDEEERKAGLETIASFLKIGPIDREVRTIWEERVLSDLPYDEAGKPATPEARRLIFELALAADASRCAELTEFGRDFEVDAAALSAFSSGILPEALARKLDVDAVAERWKNVDESWAALVFAERRIAKNDLRSTDYVYARFADEIESAPCEPLDLPEPTLRSTDGDAWEKLVVALYEGDEGALVAALKNICPQAALELVAASENARYAVDWLDVLLAGFCDASRGGVPVKIKPISARNAPSWGLPKKASLFARFKEATACLADPNESDELRENAFGELLELSETEGFRPAATAWHAFKKLGRVALDASAPALDPTDPTDPIATFLLLITPESEAASQITEETKAKIKETLVYRAALNAPLGRRFSDEELIERFELATGFNLLGNNVDWDEFERALRIGFERNPGGERTVGALWALARTAARRGVAEDCVQATLQALEATRRPDERQARFKESDREAERQAKISRAAIAFAKESPLAPTIPEGERSARIERARAAQTQRPGSRYDTEAYRRAQIERARAAQTQKSEKPPPPRFEVEQDEIEYEIVSDTARDSNDEKNNASCFVASPNNDVLLRFAALLNEGFDQARDWVIAKLKEGPSGWKLLGLCLLTAAGIFFSMWILVALLCGAF